MQTMAAADRWVNCPQALLLAEIVVRVLDPISASDTGTPREARQNPMIYLAEHAVFD